MNPLRFLRRSALLLLLSSMTLAAASAQSPREQADALLQTAGTQGGVIVHVGCGKGELTAALKQNERFVVQGLDRNQANVDAARKSLHALGVYGPVAVDRWSGDTLPFIENVVNLLVIEQGVELAEAEALRVVVPNGVILRRGPEGIARTVKPRPENIDEWTHYMHDAGGNPVADDDVVGPPRRLQWLGNPRWSRHHDRMASMSALVSSGGRIIYVMDEGSRVSIQMPPKWRLVARDAFNGTLLWKRNIDHWHSHLWPLKSGPTQLARRLVAVDDRVFTTRGIDAEIEMIDAATGETLHVFAESKGADELLVLGNRLIATVNPKGWELNEFAPKFNTGDQKRVADEFAWTETPRMIRVFDIPSGRMLWERESKAAPLTLSAVNDTVLWFNGDSVIAAALENGETRWETEKAPRRSTFPMNFGPRLMVYEDLVLFAGGERTMQAYTLADGKELWSAPHDKSGYQSPEDLMVVGGLIWTAPLTSGRDTGNYTGRHPRTGEVEVEFPPDVRTYWFHNRCYIAKATNKYLLPSRTGIEFVDFAEKSWDIHHWVRGGCLYGVMPANGLLYAPPHNCACYPEAKIYGLNALAAESKEAAPPPIGTDDPTRFEKGPAFGLATEDDAAPEDWPTYRHDNARSGKASSELPAGVDTAWERKLGGKLTAPVVAGGRLFVAQVDAHQLHAMDSATGEPLWSFTAGGRIDSPPTLHAGKAYFGSMDGWVYCLTAATGELVWRFRGAPLDRRTGVFEQIESLWPVHGTVLVREGRVWFVAGRSSFLDGGMRLIRLEAETGALIDEKLIDDHDPETGEDLQDRLQVLQMPVALPDILSAEGDLVFMRSQQFNDDAARLEIGPVSGDFAGQGGAQQGGGRHLFAPMGMLDDTWFHRSYWVYGKNFAGGHAGYYQAAKYTPSGRLLVHDDAQVFGFGRKPEYLKWTTTLEHQLFAAGVEAPSANPQGAPRGGGGRAATSMIRYGNAEGLNPTGKPLTVEAWFQADKPQGVVLARGGPAQGFALTVQEGKPRFTVRVGEKTAMAVGPERIVNKYVHVAGVLKENGDLELYVEGERVAEAKGVGLLESDPVQGLEIGGDEGGPVGDYQSPLGFSGMIDEVRLYFGKVTAEEIAKHHAEEDALQAAEATLVLASTFDSGDGGDASGKGNHGTLAGATPTAGKRGKAMKFVQRAGGGAGGQPAGTNVEFQWTQDLPLFVRGLVLAGENLLVHGPPDITNEEQTFTQLVERDSRVGELLARQDNALEGAEGSLLQVRAKHDGALVAERKLDSLPVWDGVAVARERIYITTLDGRVLCLGK